MHPGGCTAMLEPQNLRTLVGKQSRAANRDEHEPITQEEMARLSRFANEAKVAPEHRFYCVNERCARLFAVNTVEVKRRVKPFVTCPYCATTACVVCKIRWHDALTCDEIKVNEYI